MLTLERLQQVKVMITQLDVCYIIPISKKYYKLIARDLSKQRKLDVDPKAMQQINFIGTLDRGEGAALFFIIKEAKETLLDYSKQAVKVLWFFFILVKY